MHVHLEPVHVAIARVQDDTATLRQIDECPECRQAAEALDEWAILADHPDPLVIAEIQMGRRRLAKLDELSLPKALTRIESDDEFQRWGLARLIILEARRALSHADRTTRAPRLAALALHITMRLEPDFYGPDHCLRIKLQAIETGSCVLAAGLGEAELVQVLEAGFRRIHSLLEVLLSRPNAGPSSP